MSQSNAMTLFSQNVRHLLTEYGWTHQDLADAIGVHRPVVTRTLGGKNSPSLTFVENVANALDVPVKRLFEKVPEKLPQ